MCVEPVKYWETVRPELFNFISVLRSADKLPGGQYSDGESKGKWESLLFIYPAWPLVDGALFVSNGEALHLTEAAAAAGIMEDGEEGHRGVMGMQSHCPRAGGCL